MAVPEASPCYVGVARKSAAFRLMKQMVVSLSLSLAGMHICLCSCYMFILITGWICAGMGRRRGFRERQARNQRIHSSQKQTIYYWFFSFSCCFFIYLFFLMLSNSSFTWYKYIFRFAWTQVKLGIYMNFPWISCRNYVLMFL